MQGKAGHQVEQHKRPDDHKRDEVRDGEARATVGRHGVLVAATIWANHRVAHHARPVVTGEALEEEEVSGGEGLEVSLLVETLASFDKREELDAKHSVYVHEEGKEPPDVEKGRKGGDERCKQVACPLEAPHESTQAQQPRRDAQHSQQGGRDRQHCPQELRRKLVREGKKHEQEVEAIPRIRQVADRAEAEDL